MQSHSDSCFMFCVKEIIAGTITSRIKVFEMNQACSWHWGDKIYRGYKMLIRKSGEEITGSRWPR
jgi:hypothetical protein